MKNVSGYLAGRSATGLLRPKRVFMLRRPFAVFRIVLHNNSAPLTDNEDVGYQSAILFGAIVLAQLDPTSGVPLSSGNAPQSGQSEVVRLPRSFGMSQRVIAEHGTEIYKLGEWKAVCPTHHAKPTVVLMDKVIFEERRDLSYVVRAVSGERDFPLSCRLAPVRGRFTLIFVDPGHTRSPALAARTPDYVVP